MTGAPPASAPRTRLTGSAAEELACKHLIEQGLLLLQRNYRCMRGDIDLIMQHDDYVVFIEVRFRAHARYGSGAESVTPQKRAKLIAAASHFLQARHAYDRYPNRFDVISISQGADEDRIEWIKDAFQA